MSHSLDGISERLKRTYENIRNLEAEIPGFFQKCSYPVLPNLGDKKLLEAIQYHKTVKIPPRFSVLTGEIIHHLRSCLDHVVWVFTIEEFRTGKNRRYYEFPVLAKPPDENKFTQYGRKIEGIKNLDALNLIEKLQPYQRAERGLDPIDDPLWIVHEFDVQNKHRELALLSTMPAVDLPSNLAIEFAGYLNGTRGSFSTEFKREFNKYGKVTPQLAFRDFGRTESHPVILGLTELARYVTDACWEFKKINC